MSIKIFLLMGLCFNVFLFTACISNSFDKKKAIEIVNLSKSDIELYKELYNRILKDSAQIRKIMIPYGASNANYVTTNSFYLFKIDSISYSKITNELTRRNVFSDDIAICNNDGMVIFRLKRMVELKTSDYNDAYIHELIFNGQPKEYFYRFDKIVMDSVISDNIRYIFFTDKTGW